MRHVLHRYRAYSLGLGAALGLLVAATGAFVVPATDFSVHGVARVNGKEITRRELDLAVARTLGGRATARSSAAQRWNF